MQAQGERATRKVKESKSDEAQENQYSLLPVEVAQILLTLTYERFMGLVKESPQVKYYRKGQILSSELRRLRPDLHAKLIGTNRDPYFHEEGDPAWDHIVAWLKNNWGEVEDRLTDLR